MNEQKFHVGIKALITNEKKEILILKANPKELVDEKAHWDLPGGRIKEGDSFEETLRKEIKEELGIDGNKVEIVRQISGSISNIKIPVGNEKFGLVLFVYICALKGKHSFVLSQEHTEYKWASVEEAKKLLSVKFSQSFADELDKIN
jgi:8-oxo-dGTP diphosphatase